MSGRCETRAIEPCATTEPEQESRTSWTQGMRHNKEQQCPQCVAAKQDSQEERDVKFSKQSQKKTWSDAAHNEQHKTTGVNAMQMQCKL